MRNEKNEKESIEQMRKACYILADLTENLDLSEMDKMSVTRRVTEILDYINESERARKHYPPFECCSGCGCQ